MKEDNQDVLICKLQHQNEMLIKLINLLLKEDPKCGNLINTVLTEENMSSLDGQLKGFPKLRKARSKRLR